MSSLRSPGLQRSNTSGTDDTGNTETVGTGNSRPTTNSNQLDRSPDSPCLHSGPNSAAPKIINPAHKPANQQRRSPGRNDRPRTRHKPAVATSAGAGPRTDNRCVRRLADRRLRHPRTDRHPAACPTAMANQASRHQRVCHQSTRPTPAARVSSRWSPPALRFPDATPLPRLANRKPGVSPNAALTVAPPVSPCPWPGDPVRESPHAGHHAGPGPDACRGRAYRAPTRVRP